jgi:hypothetical protein
MGVFSIFGGDRPQDLMKQAKAAFEKVASIEGDSREARSLRLRMSMLCRAHLDKTFIAGAEAMAVWQEKAALAIANGEDRPEPPKASLYQTVKSGENEVYVYLPEDYTDLAFTLGGKYQRMEINASQAIEAMQGLAGQLCYYELRLEEPFQALQFLRDELAQEQAAADGEASGTDRPGGPGA